MLLQSENYATTEKDIKALDMARRIGEGLHLHYPGHVWAVNVNWDGGTAIVQNMALPGRWGFVLKLSNVENDPNLECVMRAGGELLERFKLSRSAAPNDDTLDVIAPWAEPDM